MPDPQDARPLTLTRTGEVSIDIINFTGALPSSSEVKDRNAFVRAGLASGCDLDEDGLYAVARAVTEPARTATAVKNDLLSIEVVGSVDIGITRADTWLTELFVLIQPRAGGFAHSVRPPIVRGAVDDDGKPFVELELVFDDQAHLFSYIVETVTMTRAHGQDYAESILAKRVSRPGLAHVVKLSFADGSESFRVLCVRDGITRVVSSWAAQMPHLSTHDLGVHIAASLLARQETRASSASESMARGRGREGVATDLRGRFAAGSGHGDAPSEEAVRIGQTFTLPMNICLSMKLSGPSPVATDRVFDDTIGAVIASVHGEFRPWEPTATLNSTIRRALPRAVYAGRLDSDVARLAVGELGVEDMASAFGDDAPTDPLWRAIYLMSRLTHPQTWEGIKRQLREVTGARQVTRRAYVAHLATLIDLPWQRSKATTERQARRAWSNGGPAPKSVLGVEWGPVPTNDFLDLIDDALADKVDARNTLAVAGGVALITDKLLMSAVGSAEASGLVPFRANVEVVIDGLTQSEYGLCLLAHAANSFNAQRPAVNSFTPKELAATPLLANDTYIVPKPSETNPREPLRDGANKLVPLTIYDVVYASDPARASKEKGVDAAPPPIETPAQQVNRLRTELGTSLADAVEVANKLVALATSDGAVVGGPFGDQQSFHQVDTLVRQLQLVVLSHPVAAGQETSSASAEIWYDTETGDEYAETSHEV